MEYIHALRDFVYPYYSKKDIMHDLGHIERVLHWVDKLAGGYDGTYDSDVTTYAAYFHELVYEDEKLIGKWLKDQGMTLQRIDRIISTAWEAQKEEVPSTIEGKLLHDAHMVEGGKVFLVVKSLITGSLRGQSIDKTIKYIEDNIIGKGICYLPEAQKLYDEAQDYAVGFLKELKEGL